MLPSKLLIACTTVCAFDTVPALEVNPVIILSAFNATLPTNLPIAPTTVSVADTAPAVVTSPVTGADIAAADSPDQATPLEVYSTPATKHWPTPNTAASGRSAIVP